MSTTLDISELEVIDASPVPGVYLLFLRNVLQYIGQGKDIVFRVRCHRLRALIAFDSVRIIRVANAEQRAALERDLIIEHNPPRNYVNTARARMPRKTSYIATANPCSIRWRGKNLEHAQILARLEQRSLNDWLNLTVERLWEGRQNKP